MRRSFAGLYVIFVMVAACAQDISVAQVARCDGVLQEAEGETLDGPFDADADGYFNADVDGCVETYPAEKLDCNDNDPAINPAGVEVCNGVDDDCDDLFDADDDSVDASAGTAFYADQDADGYGDAALLVYACELGEGYVDNDDDCDDSRPDVNPGAGEVDCDDLDNDCDEETPDGLDHDGDGYTECQDCQDLTPGINPGVLEVTCNDVDDDCDATTLDAPDGDGDGSSSCDDCNDADPTLSPLAEEVCDDEIDNDCDGSTDELCSFDGTYDLDTSIVYECTYGYVDIDFDQVSIQDLYPSIKVTSVGSGSQPGTMEGSFSSTVDFEAERELPGGCTETYTIVGAFTGADTFDATFTATFTGRQCLDCTDQSWSFSGRR